MAKSDALGTEHVVDLQQGPIAYRERGEGPPVVFVHGIVVNADLWRNVVPGIAEAGYRCVAPDWPLGAHERPMRENADLSPTGVARLVADFLDALALEDVTLVANDTGGAITQLVMTRYPERVGRVVLTPSDSFERFFPPILRYVSVLSHLPGSAWILSRVAGINALSRLPVTFGWLTKRPLAKGTIADYLAPLRQHVGVRRDLTRFLRGVDNRLTLDAAEQLRSFSKPVLLAWATEDKLFPFSLAERFAEVLPDARIVPIDDSYTFVTEDQPQRVVDAVVEFLRTHGRAPTPG